jgi:hypothetical protein
MGGRTDIAALRAQLAARAETLVVGLLGEPTSKGRHSWRWGNRGSLDYDFEQHLWHSFETEEGGDLFDLSASPIPAGISARRWRGRRAGSGTAAIPPATARAGDMRVLSPTRRRARCVCGARRGRPRARWSRPISRAAGFGCPTAASTRCASTRSARVEKRACRRCSA